MKAPQCFTLAFVLFLGHASIAAEQSSPQSIILASTTSVENSGLLAAILPAFTKETGITVHVLAQGTGQVLQTAARDDADLVLVHDPEAEQKFIAAGDGIDPGHAPQAMLKRVGAALVAARDKRRLRASDRLQRRDRIVGAGDMRRVGAGSDHDEIVPGDLPAVGNRSPRPFSAIPRTDYHEEAARMAPIASTTGRRTGLR